MVVVIFEELHNGDAVVPWIADPIFLRQQLGDAIFLAVGLDFFDVDHFAAFLMSSVHKVEPHL